MLAPIEDMTNATFRALCYKYGADLTFTEMVRIDSLARKNKSTWDRIQLDINTPTIIQLIGQKEQFLKKFISMFEPSKSFKGFNLNLGCPAPNFVNNGLGCAMVKRISKVRKLISAIKDRKYKVSIKMRLGANGFEKERKVYLNLIKAVNADFFIIHARHGKQGYKDKADWSVYPECVATGKPIIANGGIKTKEDVSLLEDMGVSGVMIDRKAIINPSIFGMLKGIEVPSVSELRKEYEEMSKKEEVLRYKKNILWYMGSDEKFAKQI